MMSIWNKLAGKAKRFFENGDQAAAKDSRAPPGPVGADTADLTITRKISAEEPTLPRNLRFPQPSFRVDHSLIEDPIQAELVEYLDQVALWHQQVLAFLQTSDSENLSGFSLRARSKLVEFLQPEWSAEMQGRVTRSPYNIRIFPLEALSVPRNTLAILDVLRWRAGLNDYLDDVWDVFGEPELDIDECRWIGGFLTPVTESVCSYCLTCFDSEQATDDTTNNPYQHECLLVGHAHAKWPSDPFEGQQYPNVRDQGTKG